jgi:hypothetical protein
MTSSGRVTGADAVLPAKGASFLESGLTLVVGTRGADLRPDCAFAIGLRVHPGRRRITVFLPERPAARTIENLRANGAVAVTASRPIDLETLQLKGRAVQIAAAPDGDHPFVLAYRDALAEQLEAVGHPKSVTRRLVAWPCVAVEIEIEAVFEQTPGPRAGAVLESR